jgi:hypothetical protein
MSAPISGDLLSAASLLATIISLLYAIWYSEIKEAQKTKVAFQKTDRAPDIGRVRATLRYRAFPLLGSDALLALILLPSTVDIIWDTWEACFESSGRRSYDPVEACFIAVFLFVVILAVVIVREVCDLRSLLRKLNK